MFDIFHRCHNKSMSQTFTKTFSSNMELKRFFSFSFLTGRYRRLNFRENRVNSVDFIHFFSEFLTKNIANFDKNLIKFFMKVLLIVRLETEYIVGYFHWFFLSQIPAKNFTKFRLFHQKQHEISSFSPLWLNLQEVHTQTPLTQSL